MMTNPQLLHFINNRALLPPWPGQMQHVDLAMGCFWGAERLFWPLEGVYVTMVGYQGGETLNPSYTEICQEQTGHAESVRVVFDPNTISLEQILAIFWENHDPTQGNRQGNDIGSQYRSVIFTNNKDQIEQAKLSLAATQKLLAAKGYSAITTEIVTNAKFWLAEDDHQQYLAKNPGGYCGLKGTGISCGV
ncbi:MAG: peptide-methionine (S)-S-oxide reductase MsrA [Robiginitomaculum sp.]|nr:peptide-methionine (S)-S-oxide reductase MsrA [Robiginitomaculum sp.]